MKFLALIYSNPETQAAANNTPEKQQAYIAGYWALEEAYGAKKLAAEALTPVETARCVRVRDGKPMYSDGPFAETKEQLGGFYLLDCADIDEALGLAALIPTAAHGTVEVRPIMDWSKENG